MASVGLCLITDTYTEELDKKLGAFAPYVDKIYIQVNGEVMRPKPSVGNAEVSRFKWTDNFAEARNALLKEVKTDYWLWMDSDDDIAGLRDNLQDVVSHMESTELGIMFAPYIYAIDDKGQPTEVQNRERIIKTSLKGQWMGVIHETFIPESQPFTETTTKLQWIHKKNAGDHQASMLRNRGILEHEYRKEPRDPRVAYYLGLNYGMSRDYERAIRCFEELIQTGGWDEERYRAYLQIFSCYFELSQHDKAITAALAATTELPDWPDAYFMLQQVYYQMDDYEKSLEWFKTGKSKPSPKSDSAFNPIVRGPQPLYLAATAYLFQGKPQPALKLLLELQRQYPSYDIPEPVRQTTLDAVNEERAIESAKYLIDFNQKYEGDALAVLNSLPPTIRSDVRLTEQRRDLIPGQKWPKGSIAIYCGPSFESWGPDTLDQGMGGSEEAVVYLARELALQKEGGKYRQVTVFNERQQPTEDKVVLSEYYDEDYAAKGNNADYYAGSTDFVTVDYKPWTEINPNDQFDTFICWRDPSIAKEIDAKKIICDLHDIISQESVYQAVPYVDVFCFKSQFHRELYPEVPDHKVRIIGNGIVTGQFE